LLEYKLIILGLKETMRIISILFLSTLAVFAEPIVDSARTQIGVTISYDAAYRSLDFPNGDIEKSTGVCTDVVIRALRDSHKFDLQKEVNTDMTSNFSKYPKIWGLKRTDRSIDHRRVPNLMTFFKRKGFSLGNENKKKEDFQPGDLVTCTVPGNRPHIMIVSDTKTADGIPLVIHNIGRGAVEEDRLFDFPITGHYRFNSN